MILTIALVAGLLPLLPALVFAFKRRHAPDQVTHKLVLGLSGLNLMLALMVMGFGIVWLFAPNSALAAGLLQETGTGDPYTPLAAALSVCIGSLGAAYAVATTGSAALGAIAEKPEVFGSSLIIVGLAEGVAIYGLIIAFMILNR